jgi:citrate lyase alpha subunit
MGMAKEITGVSERLPFKEIIGAVVEYRSGMMIE